jgi:NDP-sugar pyrophosphorylase family protein
MKTNVLILAASKVINSLDSKSFPEPDCLAEVSGKPLLELIVENCRSIDNIKYTFVFLKEEIDNYSLDKVAKLLAPDANIVGIPSTTQGSLCSSLLAACNFNGKDSLLIVSTNELVKINLNDPIKNFKNSRMDGGCIIMNSIHPRYSYVKLNKNNLVIEASQKNPISSHATAGIFWYQKTSDFIDGSKEMLRKDAHTDGNFYIAPVFNEMILKDKKIGVYEIGGSKYIPLKTMEHIQNYMIGENT